MARVLLWNVKQQQAEGVFPTASDATAATTRLLKKANAADPKQSGRPTLSASDFQQVSVN